VDIANQLDNILNEKVPNLRKYQKISKISNKYI